MIFNDIPQQAYAWKLKEIERSRQSLRDETFVGANGEVTSPGTTLRTTA